MWNKREAAARRSRLALQRELRQCIHALQANEAAFQQATDPCYIEQLIYQHAAELCRCRAVLRQLRTGGRP